MPATVLVLVERALAADTGVNGRIIIIAFLACLFIILVHGGVLERDVACRRLKRSCEHQQPLHCQYDKQATPTIQFPSLGDFIFIMEQHMNEQS
jgi:hypothetical protein